MEEFILEKNYCYSVNFVASMNDFILPDGSILYAGTFVCFTVLHNAYYSHLWMGLFLITTKDQTLHNSSSMELQSELQLLQPLWKHYSLRKIISSFLNTLELLYQELKLCLGIAGSAWFFLCTCRKGGGKKGGKKGKGGDKKEKRQ